MIAHPFLLLTSSDETPLDASGRLCVEQCTTLMRNCVLHVASREDGTIPSMDTRAPT